MLSSARANCAASSQAAAASNDPLISTLHACAVISSLRTCMGSSARPVGSRGALPGEVARPFPCASRLSRRSLPRSLCARRGPLLSPLWSLWSLCPVLCRMAVAGGEGQGPGHGRGGELGDEGWAFVGGGEGGQDWPAPQTLSRGGGRNRGKDKEGSRAGEEGAARTTGARTREQGQEEDSRGKRQEKGARHEEKGNKDRKWEGA